jgi:RNA polymerase sigma factor (sigma-70 family)
MELILIISHPIHEDTSASEKDKEEIRVLVEKSLASLTPAQREVLLLYYFEELSYKEIADVLHVPISTVGVRLARARASLKRILPAVSDLPL